MERNGTTDHVVPFRTFCTSISFHFVPLKGGTVAESAGRSTQNRQVPGSNPCQAPMLCPWERHFTPISSLDSGENEYLASVRAVPRIGRKMEVPCTRRATPRHVKEPTTLIEKSRGSSRCEWIKNPTVRSPGGQLEKVFITCYVTPSTKGRESQ